MNEEISRPKVGVGVILVQNGKVLLGKRKNSHGDGTWAFPGGHLEFGESIEECAKREVLEETGLKARDLKLGPYTNDIFEKEQKHYITLYVICTAEGQPQVLEPEKCEKWEWFNWEEFPENVFLTIHNLKKSGFIP